MNTSLWQTLESVEKRSDSSGKQVRAKRTALKHPHLQRDRRSSHVLGVANGERCVSVETTTTSNELGRDTLSLQCFPEQVMWHAAEGVGEVVPHDMQLAMFATSLVDDCCCEEIMFPTAVHRPEALLCVSVTLVGVQPPCEAPCQDASV